MHNFNISKNLRIYEFCWPEYFWVMQRLRRAPLIVGPFENAQKSFDFKCKFK